MYFIQIQPLITILQDSYCLALFQPRYMLLERFLNAQTDHRINTNGSVQEKTSFVFITINCSQVLEKFDERVCCASRGECFTQEQNDTVVIICIQAETSDLSVFYLNKVSFNPKDYAPIFIEQNKKHCNYVGDVVLLSQIRLTMLFHRCVV